MKDMNVLSEAHSFEGDPLTEKIIGCAIKIHRVLGPGFLESIYHRALEHEFQKLGISYASQAPIQVVYDGIVLGDYLADFVIDRRLVLEIKAIEMLTKNHEIQLVNYLNAIKIDLGLLMNFGGRKVEVKRKFRELAGSSAASSPVPHVPPVLNLR